MQPRIPTLAMCGGCTNVTNSLRKSCEAGGPGYQACNYTLPSGTFFSYQWIDGDGPDSGGFEDYFVSSPTKGRVYNSSDPSASTPITAQFGDNGEGGLSTVPVYTANFETIYQASPGNTATGAVAAISAAECALWFCVQAYDVSTTVGKQVQNVGGNWTTVFYPNTTANEGWDTIDFKNIPDDFNVVPGQTYSFSYLQLQSLRDSFDFNQTITNTEDYMNSEAGGLYVSSDIATSMWRGSQDWTHWIETLSTSLTNAIRANWPASNATHSHYAGQANSTQSYVNVRWAWLAFPAAMLLASLVFFLLSVWQTYRSSARAWKDSALVLLSVTVDPDILDKAKGYLDQLGELLRQVGKEKVFLQNQEGHLELRRVT